MAVMTTDRPISAEDERRQRVAVLHELRDQLDPPPGWRVEIIQGELVVSPAPAPAHGYIVEIIRTAIQGSLPETHAAYEAIEAVGPEGDAFIPDVSVWPRAELRGRRKPLKPDLCTVAVEVTSPKQSKHDYDKARPYAASSIPVFLVVDTERQSCVVFSEPQGGEYREKHELPFGKPVTLPLEPPVTLETGDF